MDHFPGGWQQQLRCNARRLESMKIDSGEDRRRHGPLN
jgi:hypothetical protein